MAVGLGLSLTLTLLLGGCAVPAGSVVLFREVPSTILKSTQPLPSEYEGRLLSAANGTPNIGGAAEHTHSITHTHLTSNPELTTNGAVNPLGLDETVASELHTHALISGSAQPSESAPNSILPQSRELLSRIAQHGLWNVPTGLIVGYLGQDNPLGWAECDGRDGRPEITGLYIRLKQSIASPEIVGASEHAHDASHIHAWTAGTPTDIRDAGLAIDRQSAQLPNQATAATFAHTHIVDEVQAQITTESARNLPPTFVMRFLVSDREHATMPRGAILPSLDAVAPLGWERLRVWENFQINGHLLRGSSSEFALGTTFGSATHQHRYKTIHPLTFAPSAASPVGVRVVASSTPVATETHIHAVNISNEEETAPADSLPPYVALPLIIKR